MNYLTTSFIYFSDRTIKVCGSRCEGARKPEQVIVVLTILSFTALRSIRNLRDAHDVPHMLSLRVPPPVDLLARTSKLSHCLLLIRTISARDGEN